MSRTVRLYEHHGPTSIFIDAEIGDGGEVIVSGQDIGEAPEKFYGDSDYEYWVHVPAAAKPARSPNYRKLPPRTGYCDRSSARAITAPTRPA